MQIPWSTLLDIIKDPDLKIKVSELLKENTELREENLDLKKRIENHDKIEEISKSLIFQHNHYYKENDKRQNEPFCTSCWDAKHKLVRLHSLENSIYEDDVERFECPNCSRQTHIGQFTPF